jgi:large subunit ribosomal protein L19e
MVDISYQRRMASQILKCGVHRVWVDPQQIDEVAEAVTRDDIRRLIVYRVIQKHPKKGVSRVRARKRQVQRLKGRRRGEGTRKGPLYARTPRKQQWIKTIRPIREELRRLRTEGAIDDVTYRAYYRKARGGMFKSRNHLLTQMQTSGVIKEGAVKRERLRKKKVREEGSRALKASKAREMVKQKAAETKARKKAEAKATDAAEKGGSKADEPDEEEE